MTTIRMEHDHRWMARPMPSGGILRQGLLACGILASLLYLVTDVLGGLRYPGYSFVSRRSAS